jgi:hypothetical protein
MGWPMLCQRPSAVVPGNLPVRKFGPETPISARSFPRACDGLPDMSVIFLFFFPFLFFSPFLFFFFLCFFYFSLPIVAVSFLLFFVSFFFFFFLLHFLFFNFF